MCIYIVVIMAAGCGGRPLALTSDGAVTSDGIAEIPAGDGGVLDAFCQGTTTKLIVNGSTVPAAVVSTYSKDTNAGLSLSMDLGSSTDEGVTYYFGLSNTQGATLPLTLDLAALPSAWRVDVGKTYCSPHGTDACQILGQLESAGGDHFSGSVQITGTSPGAMDRVTVCAKGWAAEQPTHSPVMSFQLYVSKKL
jgi:hypothetical protein